ncbi:ATP-dependent Clp protease proteolytic subunit [Tenacibaculum maritimum]|nr:ATP-dependent Clp protease proteolytic subunit [Tenacibaculum maritimum]
MNMKKRYYISSTLKKVVPFEIIAAAARKTPFEMTAKAVKKVAMINIKGYIHKWTSASSGNIENIIKQFKKEGITKAQVYINSEGGSVFEMTEIMNLLDDNFTTITVRVGALAASAGTRPLAKYYSTAKKNSSFMIHRPMGSPHGNEDDIEAALKLIQNMTKEYRTAYADKMGIAETEVDKMWGKGDYWMTAEEALEKGLIDEIEDAEETIDASTILVLEACGAPNIPEPTKIETPKANTNKMDKAILCAQLGLPTDATQVQIDEKLNDLKAKAAQTDTLKAAAEQKEADQKSANIKALLDDAEKDKKINATQRSNYEALATADFDSTKSIIDGLQPVGNISEQIIKKPTDAQIEATQKDWTYEDYQTKDQAAFEKLPEAKQTALIEAHYSAD